MHDLLPILQSLSPLYVVALSLFLALLPLLEMHYNPLVQRLHLLSLAWLATGLSSLAMLALVAFSPAVGSLFSFVELLELQIYTMVVILLAHLLFFIVAGFPRRKGKK